MPLVSSLFHPPAWLRNGHVQTILPTLLPRRFDRCCERERLELPDGDFLDLEWNRIGRDRLAILSHGLEGSARECGMRGLAAALEAAGWDALRWNFRGCSGEPNRLPRSYHSGETGDLAAVIAHAAPRYTRIALVGLSLGGNVVLKYLGEARPHPAVIAAVAISVPVDLAACVDAIDQRWSNRIYLRRFLRPLMAKIAAKAVHFPTQLEVCAVRGLRAFDDRYTAPLHGFHDATDYYAQSSSLQFLPRISEPTLLLNARDDPFLAPSAFPWAEAEHSAALHLEAPRSGGHGGFIDLACGVQPWSERRMVEFLGASHAGSIHSPSPR